MTQQRHNPGRIAMTRSGYTAITFEAGFEVRI
jgi:hypothetical protein